MCAYNGAMQSAPAVASSVCLLLLADTLLLYQQAYCCFGCAVAALLFQLSEQAFSSKIASQPVAGIHSRCDSCWFKLVQLHLTAVLPCVCGSGHAHLLVACASCAFALQQFCSRAMRASFISVDSACRCVPFAMLRLLLLVLWLSVSSVLLSCLCVVHVVCRLAAQSTSLHAAPAVTDQVWTRLFPQCGLAAAQQATAHLVRLHVCARGGVFAVWSLHLPDHSRACNKSAMHAVRCSNRWGCAVLCAAYIPLMCAGALCMTCCCCGDRSAGACAAAVPAVHADACCQR